MSYYGKFSYKRIREIIEYTDKALNNLEIRMFKHLKVGYYHPSYANWCYEVYAVIDINDNINLVVCTFGHILGEKENENGNTKIIKSIRF